MSKAYQEMWHGYDDEQFDLDPTKFQGEIDEWSSDEYVEWQDNYTEFQKSYGDYMLDVIPDDDMIFEDDLEFSDEGVEVGLGDYSGFEGKEGDD
jgi:hypothetical protein